MSDFKSSCTFNFCVSLSPPSPTPPSPPSPPEPRRQFELIFKMIDVDSSGTIDVDEFERVS